MSVRDRGLRRAAVDKAGSRFRSDSEIRLLEGAGGARVRVNPLLAELVAAALRAARRSDGDVDPTVGAAMRLLGYDRDLSLIPLGDGGVAVRERPLAGGRSASTAAI